MKTLELSIQDPFSEACEDGHTPRWRPYPRRVNTPDQRYGMVHCEFCLELLDYGVEKPEGVKVGRG